MNLSIIIVTKDSSTLHECVDTIRKNTHSPCEIIIVNGGKKRIKHIENTTTINMLNSYITKQINTGVNAAEDFFVSFCDDHFLQPDWDYHAFRDYEKAFPSGEGVLCLNDGRHKGKKACVVLTKKCVVASYLGGYLLDERLKHFFCDDELMDRAIFNNIYAYSVLAKIEHKHKRRREKHPFWQEDFNTYKKIKNDVAHCG